MPRRGSVTGQFSPMSGLRRFMFNNATGGTITEVANYNGTGQTWRVHTFTSGGTFTVLHQSTPFRVLVAGSPGGGGATSSSRGGAGGGGGAVSDTTTSMVPGSYAVGTASINGIAPAGGQSGAAGWNQSNPGIGGSSGNGYPGGAQSADSWRGGGGGGAAGGGNSGDAGSGGGPGVTTTIRGSSQSFGAGGSGGGQDQNGSAGQASIVVVAYRII